MQKRKKKTLKFISSETICCMKLRLYRNFHRMSLYRFYGFFYENQLYSLVAMVTWNFHSLIIGRIEKMSCSAKPLQIF